MSLKLLPIILIASMLFAVGVSATPGIPNAFYGTVTWNSQPAPDGTTVIAEINGAQVASTTTVGGKYGYPSGSFYVEDQNNNLCAGASGCPTINFFVNNVDTGQTAIFANGAVTEVDLSASGGTSTPAPSTSSSSSSGGGGGGGGAPVQSNANPSSQASLTTQGCQERWTCTDWSACNSGGVQTRTCTDTNKCGTNNNEPFTSQPCTAEQRAEAQAYPTSSITAFFLALTSTDWAIAIVAGVAIAAIVVFLSKRKVSKNKK